MIRQLILLFIIIVNPACVFYGNDFTYLPVFRAQEGGSEFDVRVGQMWLRQYVEISNGIRLLKQLRAGLRH